MVCLPVRGDNPRALASGLSPRTGSGITTVELQWLEHLWDHEN